MKLLVPIDGSCYSDNAVDFVIGLAGRLDPAPVVRLMVVVAAVPGRPVQLNSADDIQSYYDEEAALVLRPAHDKLRAAGLEAETVYSIGEPSHHIGQEAEAFGADLIVMGTRGQSNLSGLIMGSVTRGVLSRTKVPLMLLHDVKTDVKPSMRVGIAVDNSRYGIAAVRCAMQMKALFGKRAVFHLVNVAQEPRKLHMPHGMQAMGEAEIKKMQIKQFADATTQVRPVFDKAGVIPKAVALAGEPGKEIAAYAESAQLDLLILGSHGDGPLKSAMIGSTASYLTQNLNLPLILVRT